MSFRRRRLSCGGQIITPEQGTTLKQFIYDQTKGCIDKNATLYNRRNLQSIANMNICFTTAQGQSQCISKQIKGVNFVDIYRQQQRCNSITDEKHKKIVCDNLDVMIKDYQKRLTSMYRYLKGQVPPNASNIQLSMTVRCSPKSNTFSINPPVQSTPEHFQNPPQRSYIPLLIEFIIGLM